MSDVKLIHGEAIEELRKLGDSSIDMIFTDPPYGHNNNNGDLIHRREAALGRGEHGQSRAIENDGIEANELFRSAMFEFNRLLKPGGCCCCCCCGGGPDPQFARWSLWMDEIIGFKQMIIWDKGPMGMGWHYRRSYETILVGQKRGGPCKWHTERKDIENVIRPGAFGIKKIIPTESQHPTEKPVELAMFFIELHSRPGEIVLDSFCGHGSSGVAAKKLGRKFIGIELNARYVELARRRIFSVPKNLLAEAMA